MCNLSCTFDGFWCCLHIYLQTPTDRIVTSGLSAFVAECHPKSDGLIFDGYCTFNQEHHTDHLPNNSIEFPFGHQHVQRQHVPRQHVGSCQQFGIFRYHRRRVHFFKRRQRILGSLHRQTRRSTTTSIPRNQLSSQKPQNIISAD